MLGSTRFFGIYVVSQKIISSTPKRLLKTQAFEKAIISMEKNIGKTFFMLSNLTKLREEPQRVRKVFWQLLCNLYDHFFEPRRSTENLFKKVYFHREKQLDRFISYYWACHTSSSKFVGGTRSFSNHCASWKIISVTPKSLLETYFWKKGNLSSEKVLMAYFFS